MRSNNAIIKEINAFYVSLLKKKQMGQQFIKMSFCWTAVQSLALGT